MRKLLLKMGEKIYMEMRVEGRRPVGRPRKTWLEHGSRYDRARDQYKASMTGRNDIKRKSKPV